MLKPAWASTRVHYNAEAQQGGYNWDHESRQRSSEVGGFHVTEHEHLSIADAPSQEPGQARHASRPVSLIGSQFGLLEPGHDLLSGSQRSAVFPWDNAGASSSVNGALDFGRNSSVRRSFGRADTRLRGSSVSSRRESPAVPGRHSDSPSGFGHRNLEIGENFEFDGK